MFCCWLDAIAALAVAGRLRGRSAAATAFLAALLFAGADHASAQEDAAQPAERAEAAVEEEFLDPAARRAALDAVLAYVITGDRAVDEASAGGLLGLTAMLHARTSIEPGEPARA